jgi:hypothetical protein
MLDFDDLPTYELLIAAGKPYGVDPSSSIACEQFFRALLPAYAGPLDPLSVAGWLEAQIQSHFRALDGPPAWIQSSEWPFADGQPMIFAGQINYSIGQGGLTAQLFHADTSFYLFIAPKRAPLVITQQF